MEKSYGMKKVVFLLMVCLACAKAAPSQTIPKELWGTWVVRREVPTHTISCWGEKEAKKIIGTEIEYSAQRFRWKRVVTKNPDVETKTVIAQQFHDGNSGGGANSSQITFAQLGIKAERVVQITIRHPSATITEATGEIPGDNVLLKDKSTIIFSVCNVYFEAERRTPPP
jgi:hypothetical protein